MPQLRRPALFLDDGLERSAEKYPEKPALVCGIQRLSYGHLNALVNRFAEGMARAGICRGERVAIFLDNSVEALVAVFGVLRAGAVLVPIGATVKSQKLAHILVDSQAAAVVTSSSLAGQARSSLRDAPGVRVGIVSGQPTDLGAVRSVQFESLIDTAESDAGPSITRIDLDLAAIMYTSGSTGTAKGVTLRHVNMVAAVTSIQRYLENTVADVILDVLPLSFDYGLYQAFLAFDGGATLVLEPASAYSSAILDVLEREQVTGLPLVPTLAALLLRHDLAAYELRLRYITSTGAVFPPAHIAALRRQLPRVRIFSMYGLTECKRVSYLPPEEIDARPASVGKPMDNVEVYVETENGILSQTGIGQLVVRGSNVMEGYWRAPELNARALRPGPIPGQHLLRTGDEFRIDEDGYLYFIGRLDDLIKSCGQRVSPREIEDVIYELSDVTGVIVTGIPDEIKGNRIVAYVTVHPRSTLTDSEVKCHCKKRLESLLVPDLIEFVDVLPRTDSGKLDRNQVARAHH